MEGRSADCSRHGVVPGLQAVHALPCFSPAIAEPLPPPLAVRVGPPSCTGRFGPAGPGRDPHPPSSSLWSRCLLRSWVVWAGAVLTVVARPSGGLVALRDLYARHFFSPSLALGLWSVSLRPPYVPLQDGGEDAPLPSRTGGPWCAEGRKRRQGGKDGVCTTQFQEMLQIALANYTCHLKPLTGLSLTFSTDENTRRKRVKISERKFPSENSKYAIKRVLAGYMSNVENSLGTVSTCTRIFNGDA
jgi:hypothetical protein